MKRNAEGVWTGDSAPQDEGFHYYQFEVDGASVPAHDQDLYALKNVPHGDTASDAGDLVYGFDKQSLKCYIANYVSFSLVDLSKTAPAGYVEQDTIKGRS